MFEINHEILQALKLSVQVALCCTLVTAIPGAMAGWLLARWNFPGKTLVDGLVHLPLVVPPVVVGYSLLLLLGRNGWIGRYLDEWFGLGLSFTFWGAVIASAVCAFPLVVRSVRVAVELVDLRLEAAAATLGAGPLRRLLTVTAPLALPGILAGLTLAFARSLGEFGATMTFAGNLQGETRTLSLAVFGAMQTPGRESFVATLAAISIALAVGSLIVSELLSRWMRTRLG